MPVTMNSTTDTFTGGYSDSDGSSRTYTDIFSTSSQDSNARWHMGNCPDGPPNDDLGSLYLVGSGGDMIELTANDQRVFPGDHDCDCPDMLSVFMGSQQDGAGSQTEDFGVNINLELLENDGSNSDLTNFGAMESFIATVAVDHTDLLAGAELFA